MTMMSNNITANVPSIAVRCVFSSTKFQKQINMNTEQKFQNSIEVRNDDNAVLAAGVVSEIADQYEEQVRLEKLYQEDKKQKIKELEQMISSSMNKPIYKLLYKPEYGDYRQFVEDVAKELRRRNACR